MTVDGKDSGTKVLFDKYCRRNRMSWVSAVSGLDPESEHTVTLEIMPDPPNAPGQPGRVSKGTVFKVGGVMTDGVVVKKEEV
jgi:hypothetical protein